MIGAQVKRKKEIRRGNQMLGLILIIVLAVALIGAVPRYGYSRDWGYAPSGGIGLVLAIVIILVLLRYI